MTVLHQPATMGDVLKYEVNPNYTRETVTLLEGTNYPVGAVLGRITASSPLNGFESATVSACMPQSASQRGSTKA